MSEISETKVMSIRRRISEMSSKDRIKLVLRLLVTVLCVLGLTLMTTELVVQYSKRQTVVNIQIETIKYNKIPAITLCYPRYLSMERVLNRFPQFRQKFDEIQNQFINDSKSEHKSEVLIEFYQNLTHFVENSDLSIDKLFDLSIPFEFRRSLNPIEIKVKGIRLINKLLVEFEKQDMVPIESIVFSSGQQGFKCFTFFHHLNAEMSEYQMDVKEISIEIFHKEEWFPLELYHNSPMIPFSMHSPQSFPQQMNVNNFLRLKAAKEYEITYNRLKTILMEPPYQTMCRKYHLKDKTDRMRSDCVNNCIQAELIMKCLNKSGNNEQISGNSTNCFFRSDALRRKTYSFESNETSLKLCPKLSVYPKHSSIEGQRKCISDNINHLNSECETRCGPECLSRFYNYNIKANIKHTLTDWYRKNGHRIVSITVAHNQMPDQITEHISEMTFTQFAANFGGLFGMWLGLSALTILQYLLKLL